MNTANINLGRQTVLSLLAKFSMAGLGFVGIVLFANILGAQGLGKYYFVLAASQVLSQVMGGLGTALKKRVSEVKTNPQEFLGLGLIAHISYIGIVIPILLISSPYLPTDMRDPLLIIAFIGFFSVSGLFTIFHKFYAGLGNPAKSVWFDTFRSFLTLVGQITFIFAGYESAGLLIGLALATFVTTIILFLYTGVKPEMPTKSTIKSVFDFGKWSIPTTLIAQFYNRLDVLILGWFIGSSAVGYYESALKLALPASLLASSIGNPLSVKTSGKSSQGDNINTDFKNSVTYSGLLSIPLFFGALGLGDQLMATIFGPTFTGTGTVLIGLAFYYIIYSYQYPFSAVFTGIGRPDFIFRTRLVGLLFHIPAVIYLGMRFGIMGVISSTILSEIIMLLIYQYISYGETGDIVFSSAIVPQVVSGALMYGVVILVKDLMKLDSYISVGFIVFLGGVVYFISLLILSNHIRTTIDSVIFEPLGYPNALSSLMN